MFLYDGFDLADGFLVINQVTLSFVLDASDPVLCLQRSDSIRCVCDVEIPHRRKKTNKQPHKMGPHNLTALKNAMRLSSDR